MKQLIQKIQTPKGYVACFTIFILIAATVGYLVISSFTTVVFNFDSSKGSITLVDSDKQKFHPQSGMEISLKKGNYILTKNGEHIAHDSHTITIDGTKKALPVELNYTDEYLQQLYSQQKVAIYATILQKYPSVKSDYTIRGGRLYNQGDWFGAALVYNDRDSENRDTLHILLAKEADEWRIVSTPPTPILSQKNFPDAPYETLVSINRVK